VLGIQEFPTEATTPIPEGTHQVRMEFAYDGGGLAKGGDVTLYYDGTEVGSGRVGATQPMVFSADETTDIGYESGTTVSSDYTAHGSRFTGKINWVQLDLGKDDHDHFIDPRNACASLWQGSRCASRGSARRLRVLLLYLTTRSSAEAVRTSRRHPAITGTPGSQGAAGQRDDIDDAARKLHVVRHSHQNGALGHSRHEAQSFAEMIIGCRGAVDSGRVLVVRRLGAKIIKREDLHLPSVGSWAILVRRGHGQSGLGVTQPRRCQDYAAPELITGGRRPGDTCDVLSQTGARRQGGATRGEELHAAGIGRASNVLGGNPDRQMSRAADPYAVQDLAEGIVILRSAWNS
jgi:hypothetical protein